MGRVAKRVETPTQKGRVPYEEGSDDPDQGREAREGSLKDNRQPVPALAKGSAGTPPPLVL